MKSGCRPASRQLLSSGTPSSNRAQRDCLVDDIRAGTNVQTSFDWFPRLPLRMAQIIYDSFAAHDSTQSREDPGSKNLESYGSCVQNKRA
ncbi:hypothetical protein VTL71DRAFT_11103 [Oculimacula yallundae]|uniref:Uncharacterized protein n=1 Tax=Oculimacula yallundae TaxID=86028 RepID=A0ABR4CVB7_9HELO